MNNLKSDYHYHCDLFKVTTKDKFGEDWPIAFSAGESQDGNEYLITTDHVRASDIPDTVMDAKETAELIVTLLNLYHRGFLFVEDPNQLNLLGGENGKD